MSLNYHHLRYFWAVARDGNLTRTAEALNVSQSSLSLQIRKLEERLGQDLFERRGRQLVLTEAGQIALDHADIIFAAGEEMVDMLLDRGAGQARTLRVGSLSTLSRNFQINFLRPAFALPDTRVMVRSGSLPELTHLLENKKLDIVLTNQVPVRTADAIWLAEQLSEQTVSLIGAPHRAPGDRSLDDILRTEPLVLPSKDSGIRLAFDALVDRMDLTPKVVAEVDDMALLRLLARDDTGLTLVPPIVVEGELGAGQLIEVAALPQLTESFYALTMARRFPNPAVKALFDAVATGSLVHHP